MVYFLNAPCAASIDDVFISFKGIPTVANAGPDKLDISTCGLTAVTLAGNNPSTGTGLWTITSELAALLVTHPYLIRLLANCR
jgi:hypothetical protein